MEFLSNALQRSDKYNNAVKNLPDGWELLVTLNNMILKYGVRNWKKDLLKKR